MNNIALFIDFENIGYKSKIDIGSLINSLKNKGRVILKKAYADWSYFEKYKKTMVENTIELVELPQHTQRGKNGADIRLVVDALETAITKDYIHTIVLVSGDSDFLPLIYKLRAYNKYVIVVGKNKKTTSNLITKSCDEFYYYPELTGKPSYSEKDYEGFYLLIKALSQLNEENEVTQYSLEQVKNSMVQTLKFNTEDYGYHRFTDFIEDAQIQGFIYLEQKNTTYFIRQKMALQDLLIPKNLPLKDFEIEKIYWAIKMSAENIEETIDLNTVVTNIQKLYPDFKITDYISRSKGFKGLMERIEKKGYINLKYQKGNNQYVLWATKKMQEEFKDKEQPKDFIQVDSKPIVKIKKIASKTNTQRTATNHKKVIKKRVSKQTTYLVFDPKLLYWAIKLTASDLFSNVSLSDLAKNIRSLNPDFKTTTYINKTSGFKGLMKRQENDGYIIMRQKESKNGYWISATKKLITAYQDCPKPENFDILFAERLLFSNNINITINHILEGTTTLQNVLDDLEEKEILLEELYKKYQNAIHHSELKQPIRVTLLTIMMLNDVRNSEHTLVKFGQNDIINLHKIKLRTYEFEDCVFIFKEILKYIDTSENVSYATLLQVFYDRNDLSN